MTGWLSRRLYGLGSLACRVSITADALAVWLDARAEALNPNLPKRKAA